MRRRIFDFDKIKVRTSHQVTMAEINSEEQKDDLFRMEQGELTENSIKAIMNEEKAVAAEENGIYRIHLADGSYEVIESNANDDTEIHVVSDDCIYIIQGKLNILHRYRQHVYKFDYRTGNKKKLTVM